MNSILSLPLSAHALPLLPIGHPYLGIELLGRQSPRDRLGAGGVLRQGGRLAFRDDQALGSARLPEKTRDRNGARLPRARENRAGIVNLAVCATTSSIQPSTSLAPGSSKSSHSPLARLMPAGTPPFATNWQPAWSATRWVWSVDPASQTMTSRTIPSTAPPISDASVRESPSSSFRVSISTLSIFSRIAESFCPRQLSGFSQAFPPCYMDGGPFSSSVFPEGSRI